MKVSFVLSSLSLSGGVLNIIEVTNRLVARGHDIDYIIPGETYDYDTGNIIHPAVKVIATRTSGVGGHSKIGFLQRARLTWELARAVQPSDIVVSTQTPTTLAVGIACWLNHVKGALWYYQDYLEMFSYRPIESWLLKNAMHWHQQAAVLSHSSKQELKQFTSKAITVIGCGISDVEKFQPLPDPSIASSLRISHKKKNILFLGDMRPRKGLFDFLAAIELVCAQRSDIHLWVVSKDECKITSSASCEFIYRPSRSELARLYKLCDVFVSASWWESFGLPPLEAMACGAPAVITDSRGSRDYADSGVNCLVVPPRNPPALADGILAILANPELADRFRRNGPLTASKFTWDRTVDLFEKALIEVSRHAS